MEDEEFISGYRHGAYSPNRKSSMELLIFFISIYLYTVMKAICQCKFKKRFHAEKNLSSGDRQNVQAALESS
jgi:hypothetical protein